MGPSRSGGACRSGSALSTPRVLELVDGRTLAGPSIADAEDAEPLAFADLRLHVLRAGWGYEIESRRVFVPDRAAAGAEP